LKWFPEANNKSSAFFSLQTGKLGVLIKDDDEQLVEAKN
jgi:hypothetical protein